jgi:hypothetical protein
MTGLLYHTDFFKNKSIGFEQRARVIAEAGCSSYGRAGYKYSPEGTPAYVS